MYQPFDDRPGKCEGCQQPDYPSIDGPSAKQISWNGILTLWLCAECRHQYAEWMGRCYVNHEDREKHKPGFMKLRDK